jgi:CheY-like chemotaxis protein
MAVLCIEDSATSRQYIVMAMRQRPHVVVVEAADGGEGITLANARTPDLILLDGHLPDMTGADVIRRLKGAPATRDIPVVVLTGESRAEAHAEILAAGAIACLVKPINVAHLIELVDRHLPGHDAVP